MTFDNFFKIHLKKVRESHNLSMSELAELLSLTSSAAVSQFETGKSFPSYYMLLQIALLFGVSLEWLTGLSDVQYTKTSIKAAQKYLETRITTLNAEKLIKDTIKWYKKDFPNMVHLYQPSSGKHFLEAKIEISNTENSDYNYLAKHLINIDLSVIPDDAIPMITGHVIFLMHATFLHDLEHDGNLQSITDFLKGFSPKNRRLQLLTKKHDRYIQLLEYYTQGWDLL